MERARIYLKRKIREKRKTTKKNKKRKKSDNALLHTSIKDNKKEQ